MEPIAHIQHPAGPASSGLLTGTIVLLHRTYAESRPAPPDLLSQRLEGCLRGGAGGRTLWAEAPGDSGGPSLPVSRAE